MCLFTMERINQIRMSNSLITRSAESPVRRVNILKEVIAACKDGSRWKEKREQMMEYKEIFFAAQRRVVEGTLTAALRLENFLQGTSRRWNIPLSAPRTSSRIISEQQPAVHYSGYRYMANCVKVLKQNVRNVRSQTKFNSVDLFNTFYEVEKLSEEVRLLKVM